MLVKIKRLTETAKIPAYKTEGAAGCDLYADEDVLIPAHCTVMVHTGIAVELPEFGELGITDLVENRKGNGECWYWAGLEMQICPRSGLAIKNGITIANAPGIVDSDYRGEVCVLLHNTTRAPFQVKRGDRIAQAVFVPVIRAEFEEVAELSETKRGKGGFGSTGVK